MDHKQHRGPKNWQGGNDQNQTQAPRTHNVAAHNFEEQQGSRNSRAYGTEPTKHKHQVKHAAIQEKELQQEQQDLGLWKQQSACTKQVQQCRTPFRETVQHQQQSSGP